MALATLSVWGLALAAHVGVVSSGLASGAGGVCRLFAERAVGYVLAARRELRRSTPDRRAG